MDGIANAFKAAPAAYAPRSGTLPDQVLKYLKRQPPGTTLTVAQMVERFKADAASAATLLRRTVNEDLLVATRKGNALQYALPGNVTAAAPAAPMAIGAARDGYGFQVLDRSAIVPSLTNPRSWFDPVALGELADSIKASGLAQPILVRKLPAGRVGETFTDRRKGDPLPTHEIIAGERRWRACGIAAVRSVPVLIRDLNDEEVLDIQLVENMQRADLHPLEEAAGYRRILDLPQHAELLMEDRISHLSGRIKKSTRYIYQTLQLLQLCDFARTVFLENKLQRTVALQIATIGNEAQQIEATRRIAGLAKTSTEVVENPMSQREAAGYVRENFRLLLSKAPFPVKVAYAGLHACITCPKMSANAAELFDAPAGKVPDTCMDPSCYGKKNAAHTEQLAGAAKARGQRVVTGAAARKAVPYAGSPDHLDDGYVAMDKRHHELTGKDYGKTTRQILGKDAPLPVLIQNPHGPGFIEALPEAEVKKLFKDRGVSSHQGGGKSDDEKAKEKKAKVENAFRAAVAVKLMDHAASIDPLTLLPQIIREAALHMYSRLDNEVSKRTRKLMEWDIERGGSHDKKTREHFAALGVEDVVLFLLAASIAGETQVNAWNGGHGTPTLDALSKVLDVDMAGMKKSMAHQVARPGQAAPAKSAATPFAVGDRVRFKDGLKGPTGHLRKVSGREGVIKAVRGQHRRTLHVMTDGSKEVAVANPQDLDLVAAAGTNKARAEEQLDLPVAGAMLNPVAAWPFPTASKVREAAA